MITKNNSWSLGATPNKSLDHSPQAVAVGVNREPSIPIHLPGDPLANHPRKNSVHSGLILLAPAPLFASAIALLIDRAQGNHLHSFSIAPDRSDRFLNSNRSFPLNLNLNLNLSPNSESPIAHRPSPIAHRPSLITHHSSLITNH